MARERGYALEALKTQLQEYIFDYLYNFSDAELMENDAEEEAGIIAEEAVKQVKEVEKNYQ